MAWFGKATQRGGLDAAQVKQLDTLIAQVQKHPDDARLRKELGELYAALQMPNDAAREFRALVAMLMDAGLTLRARAACQQLLTVAPDDEDARTLLETLEPTDERALELTPQQLADAVQGGRATVPPPAPADSDPGSAVLPPLELDLEADAHADAHADVDADSPVDVDLRSLEGAAEPADVVQKNITLEVMPADVLIEHEDDDVEHDLDIPTAPDGMVEVDLDATEPLFPTDALALLAERFARGAPLCAGLDVPGGALDRALREALDVVELPAGAALMRAGQVAPGVYVIERGDVHVVGSSDVGGVEPFRLGAGAVLGEACALPDNVASSDVLAVGPTTALFFERAELLRVAAFAPALRARLAKWSVLRRAWSSALRPDQPHQLS